MPKRRSNTPDQAARHVKGELARLSRAFPGFDARRYFRGGGDLEFYNVGTPAVRNLARSLFRDHRDTWSVTDAAAFAENIIQDPFLEAKAVGIELLACYRREFKTSFLATWKRWLARDHASNWATTDEMCGSLIGPLLVEHPELVARVASWSSHQNKWVRRASAVALISSLRRGAALDAAYGIARRLQADRDDLIQKAVGWMLREAGKADVVRLERYLRSNGSRTPRTTLRYAIERFPDATRRTLLEVTRVGAQGRPRKAERLTRPR